MPNIYNFKRIQVVPNAKDFVDITLSKTNRKTPTIVHKGYAIARIRQFYMRKVKYTSQNFHDKLTQILEDFPLLDDVHPFYADLMNVLYDRDHYKLALGQLNTCRHLIDNLAQDYNRLLKYGNSLYQCKQLKRAALGRMCTLAKKQDATLQYLEQVRQHLSRLPSIDPNTRTLLLCGYPNVGKSSFMNLLTRSDVEVQPYPFTTKSLFVGHTDFHYARWQVIDTPGILDHPLEECNTIEMQSITAMAHIRAAIIYFIDVSEQCGYSIKEQLALFDNIKPLFANKPLVVAANKIDVIRPEQLESDHKALLQRFEEKNNLKIVPMSTLSEEGVMDVKLKACQALLEQRVEIKMKSKHIHDVMNRIYVAAPKVRDHKARPSVDIPSEVIEKRIQKKKLEEEKKAKEEEEKTMTVTYDAVYDDYDSDREPGDSGEPDWREDYRLNNDDWKFDTIPEIMDGQNIADFIDPDIEEMLDLLEKEEEEQMRLLESMMEEEGDEVPELSEEDLALANAIREKRSALIHDHQMKVGTNRPILPRKAKQKDSEEFKEHLEELGIDPSKAVERARSKSRSRTQASPSRGRSEERVLGKRSRDEVELSKSPGLPLKQRKLAKKLAHDAQKHGNAEGRAGESDRRISASKPKHLFSGKRGMGKTDRR